MTHPVPCISCGAEARQALDPRKHGALRCCEACGDGDRWRIVTADVLVALRDQPDDSFDAAVLDPPYGLGPKQPTLDELRAYLDSADLDTGGDFMGADWSVPSIAVWRELLRVLKPGAPMLAFAGSRTVDLIALGIRAAGFEIKDTIEWIYGQSMPKPASTTDKYLDWHAGAEREVVGENPRAAQQTPKRGGAALGDFAGTRIELTAPATAEVKRWKGYGHALKPGHEPVIVARKPLVGSIAENILLWDVCGLNVEWCRLGASGGTQKPKQAISDGKRLGTDKRVTAYGHGLNAPCSPEPIDAGRWPSNVCVSHAPECVRTGERHGKRPMFASRPHDPLKTRGFTRGSLAQVQVAEVAEVWSCVDWCPVKLIDAQSGDRPATLTGRADPNATHANPGDNGGASTFGGGNSRVYADEGGASRYFATFPAEESVPFRYMAKVSTAEREFGCEGLPFKTPGECTDREDGSAGLGPQAGAGRSGGARNHHPTLKRIPFAKWLATLVLPPRRESSARRLIIPYSGAGSEMVGAIRAGWDEVLGIEREPEFVAIARARIARWLEVPVHMDESEVTGAAEKPSAAQPSLFDKVPT